MADEEKKDVFTIEELAEEWNIPRRRVLDLINSGKLHAFAVGSRTCRITREQIDQFIAENPAKPDGK